MYKFLLSLMAVQVCFVSVLFGQSNIPNNVVKPGVVASKAIPACYAKVPSEYVRTFIPGKPIQDTGLININSLVEDVAISTFYADSYGRPLQTINRQATPAKSDYVSPAVYDEFGRVGRSYLPFAAQSGNTSDGNFKADAFYQDSIFYKGLFPNEQVNYGEQTFDNSPLNMTVKTTAPGNSWTGSNIGVSYVVRANREADSVRVWNIDIASEADVPSSPSVYQAGTLTVQEITDEKGIKSVKYIDVLGRPVLIKTQLSSSASSGHTGWLCTYYVYDEMNHVRMVIPPKGVSWLLGNDWSFSYGNGSSALATELCFRYFYDAKGRLIIKGVPGAGWLYLVYDNRDRQVFMQDANMRAAGKWMYILYDSRNRALQTGIMSYNGVRDSLQAYATRSTNNSPAITAGVYSPRIPIDVTYNNRDRSITDYTATNSIVLDDGFESSAKDSFTAEIVTGRDSVFTASAEVNNNPIPAGTDYTPLILNYYDDYSWTERSYSTVDNSKLDEGSNRYADALPIAASKRIRGRATGSRVRVVEDPGDLTKGNWLETVVFYDEKGRNIQASSDNYKGGQDVATIRYDFTGKVVCTYLVHNNPAAHYRIRTKTNMDYDHAGRLLTVTKKLNDNDSTKRTITRNTYNELGQLLNKKIGQKKFGDASAMESQDYQFNIRGWMKGINWDYSSADGTKPQTNKWFAMDLSYDWGFTNSEYNGNIAGIRWQSKGDGAERAYGFGYDNTNRLMYAEFNQRFNSSWAKADPGNTSFNIDFSIKMGDGQSGASAYDDNGNIKTMQQKGLILNSSTTVDSLLYTYSINSNKLTAVTDAVTANNNVGDFSDRNTTLDDYSYDANGNLTSDKNKSISSISYNHLNLPYQTTVARSNGEGGSIIYIYDATGRKLEKRVLTNATASAGAKTTYTTYIGGFEYMDNSLQYFAMEEGRIRPSLSGESAAATGFSYDYFLKDHLGNIRTVLTDEQRVDAYPVASLESGTLNNEKIYYTLPDDPSVRVNKESIPDYPDDPYTAPNDFVHRLNGNGTKIGAGIVLKVMSGDKVNIRANSWYRTNGANPGTPVSPLSDLISALSSGIVGTVGGNKLAPLQLQQPGVLSPGIGDFLTKETNTSETSKPKAFLNFVLYDEQFKAVITDDGKNTGFDQVGNDQEYKTHTVTDREITKNGYLYIYVSNETPNIDVFFDNLQVTHTRGPLVEENHYYPFGLLMSAISSKAAGSIQNKRKFNDGSELNTDFELDIYETAFRGYDPQIGRFGGIDPKAELAVSLSSFHFSNNNPISFNDPLGDTYRDANGNVWHSQDLFAGTAAENGGVTDFGGGGGGAFAIDGGFTFTGAAALELFKTIFSNSVDQQEQNKQKDRPDLGALGNIIRSFAGSDFSKDLFENFWKNKGTFYLSNEEFQDIANEAEKAGAKNLPGIEIKLMGKTYTAKSISFYSSEKYDKALGTATLLYDTHGKAVGFYDKYDFDPKSWGERSISAENKTRLVFIASFVQGAKAFNVVYGQGISYYQKYVPE